ncbi:MAG: hypothetical protein V4619_13165 [Bacteroidota bacterium]
MKKLFVIAACLICFFTKTGLAQIKQQSTVSPPQYDNNETLLKYMEKLDEDAVKHRAFVESYYNKLYETVLGAGALFSVLLTLFGRGYFNYQVDKYKKDLKGRFNEHYQAQFDEHKNTLQNQIKEIDKSREEMNGLIAHFQENIDAFKADAESNKAILIGINEMYTDLSSKVVGNYEILSSITRLEYLKPDGSEVTYIKNQTVQCISPDRPVKVIDHFLNIQEPGEVELISVKPSERVFKPIKINPQRQNIRLEFDDFTAESSAKSNEIIWKVTNGFTGNSEVFTINQLNKCHDEIFELVFLEERECSDLTCEAVDSSGAASKIEYISNLERKDGKAIYRLKLPERPLPCKYRITWDF